LSGEPLLLPPPHEANSSANASSVAGRLIILRLIDIVISPDVVCR
jgi:hypothetical protein